MKEDLNARGIGEDRYKLFLRGGQWDNFLTKYEESNHLHKRMLLVSRKVKLLDPDIAGNPVVRLKALYRGQCNCAQWHGLVRRGCTSIISGTRLYHDLIEAENIADARLKAVRFRAEASISISTDATRSGWPIPR